MAKYEKRVYLDLPLKKNFPKPNDQCDQHLAYRNKFVQDGGWIKFTPDRTEHDLVIFLSKGEAEFFTSMANPTIRTLITESTRAYEIIADPSLKNIQEDIPQMLPFYTCAFLISCGELFGVDMTQTPRDQKREAMDYLYAQDFYKNSVVKSVPHKVIHLIDQSLSTRIKSNIKSQLWMDFP